MYVDLGLGSSVDLLQGSVCGSRLRYYVDFLRRSLCGSSASSVDILRGIVVNIGQRSVCGSTPRECMWI
jgi:hypothetical protein